ncbi:MAG: hypothetical protein QM501_15285, partial [Gimesia sp.]
MSLFDNRLTHWVLCWLLTFTVCISFCLQTCATASAQELSAKSVADSIERGQEFLLKKQNDNGSWSAPGANYTVGVSSLALMALVNCGMTAETEPVQRGLKYLRSVKFSNIKGTYQSSLMIMALAAAKDGKRDLTLIQ